MPITTLTPDAINASRAASLLAVQVRKDLIATGQFDDAECTLMTGPIVGALIGSLCDDANRQSSIASRMGR